MRTDAFTQEDHFALRRKGIGGTDITAIVGLSPWKTAFDVFCEKMGLVEPSPPTVRQRIGLAVEPLIRALYEEQTGRRLADKTCIQHPDRPWMCGEIDGFVIPAQEDRGIDYKNVSLWGSTAKELDSWGAEGTDVVPSYYLTQAAWYQAITETEHWDITPLRNERLRIYTVRRDPDLEGMLIEAGERFRRDHLETGRAPEITGAASTAETLKRLFPAHDADMIAAPLEAQTWLTLRQGLKQQIADLEEHYALAENNLKALVGDHAGLRFPDGAQFTWKKTKDSVEVDWKGLALHLQPVPKILADFTRTRPGYRRVFVKLNKSED